MEQNFYIADLHLRHEGVISFDQRPFSCLKDMEDAVIQNWNSRVGRKDCVYILGDFIWGDEKAWRELVPKFSGRKVLIKGNHDLSRLSPMVRSNFEDVRSYREIYDRCRRVVLCHYPILMHNGSFSRNTYMLYGHVHLSREFDLMEYFVDIMKQKTASCDGQGPQGQIYNAGCMTPWMDYTPRTLDEIIQRYGEYRKSRNVIC